MHRVKRASFPKLSGPWLVRAGGMFLLFTVAFGFGVTPSAVPATPGRQVFLIQLNDDTINPVTAEYISQAIDQSAADRAECLIIKMDTPGGLLNSTRSIVKKIMASSVPVVVYIAPSGSRAGSAGVFITYASHVAAMAPSTNIGAAHPVQMGDQGKRRDVWDGLKELLEKSRDRSAEPTPKKDGAAGDKKDRSAKPSPERDLDEITPDADPLSSKILQDTVAFVKALAMKRHRNIEWAVQSVTESSSVTETEALALGVVELIAKDEQELLEKLDGKTVAIGGQERILQTRDATIQAIPMQPRQKFLNILANPNIAYILMILGFYGLLYEVTHPGFGVPGILGTIFLILAFFSMQTLPTNYAGLALLILGLGLFVGEAVTPGFGLLALGGMVCMILGSLLLFDASVPMMKVSLSLILSFTLTTAAITLFLIRAVFRAHRRKALGGQEGLVGAKAEVRGALSPGRPGKVFVHGELWNAEADEAIGRDEKVVVQAIDGMTLKVKRMT